MQKIKNKYKCNPEIVNAYIKNSQEMSWQWPEIAEN